jgi:crossover junction endodeoxyribonuclease RuvC
LAELQHELRALIAELKPDVVAVERVFFQVNVRTAMSVGQASGLAMAEAFSAGCDVAQYSPNEVKLAVAGNALMLLPARSGLRPLRDGAREAG